MAVLNSDISSSMIGKTKVWVEDLCKGMYVSHLDRPWVETPFKFQGFTIQSQEDIQNLKRFCKFVVVDRERSQLNASQRFPLSRDTGSKPNTGSPNPEASTSLILPSSKIFKVQMQQAMSTHRSARQYISRVMDDVSHGREIDVKQAKALVQGLTENIIQNPTALIWLTNLRNRDEYTAIHSLNVCVLSLFFGRSLGLNHDQLQDLGTGALLHDIGKIKVPLEVLNKPGSLTQEEFVVMKKHTMYGYELFRDKEEISQASMNVIKNHHERLDGKGYPHGLAESQLDQYSKMVTIVDVFDAITSNRVYHNEITPYNALNRIYSEKEDIFDRKLVEQFIKYMGVYPIGSVVELSTGQVGLVSSFNEKRHLYPTVLLIMDEKHQRYAQPKIINLSSNSWENDAKRPSIKKIVDPGSYDLDISDIFLKESIQVTR